MTSDLPPACPFGTFHHVGIVVPADQHDATVSTFTTLLGATISDGGEDEPLDIRWTFLESAGNPIFEIASPMGNKESAMTRFLDQGRRGLHHVSFETAHLPDSLAHTTSAGIPVIGHEEDHGGFAEFFVSPTVTGGALVHVLEDRRGVTA